MSNKYVHFVTDMSVMVLDTSNGEQVKFFKEDERYKRACDLIVDGKHAEVFGLDVKHVVVNFFKQSNSTKSVEINIDSGVGKLYLKDFNITVPLNSVLVNRIIKMYEQGFDCLPLVNFIGNLYSNPSSTAVDELYLFIESCELPITEDGHFIAYKIVRDDYMDIYTGKMDNSVGKVLQMPRNMVDDDRNRTCSAGLHFCSKGYLRSYGSSGSRCMLVKINPADVVAIPSDYNNAKGRSWKYEVIGEAPSGWREALPVKDFTDSAVVTSTGAESTKTEIQPEAEADDVLPTYSDAFADGYNDGYADGRKREPFVDRDDASIADSTKTEIEYNDGYDTGYSHGRLHRRRIC